tara:strand:- start:733 stop:1164 length:432 start_codon:yes stop_codon:yes gene_type:complete
MMKKQLSIIIIAILALAACGSSGKPQSFDEQRGPLKEDYKPYSAELLGADRNSNDVPLVHRNFIEGCMSAGLIEFEEGSEQLINLATRCGCSYAGLVRFVETLTPTRSQAFKLFEDFDKQLKDENGFANLDDRVKDIFSSCQS